MRKGNKYLWGVRLFEEADTAVTRRLARGIRRRYDRRRQRIALLQEEFRISLVYKKKITKSKQKRQPTRLSNTKTYLIYYLLNLEPSPKDLLSSDKKL